MQRVFLSALCSAYSLCCAPRNLSDAAVTLKTVNGTYSHYQLIWPRCVHVWRCGAVCVLSTSIRNPSYSLLQALCKLTPHSLPFDVDIPNPAWRDSATVRLPVGDGVDGDTDPECGVCPTLWPSGRNSPASISRQEHKGPQTKLDLWLV